MENIILKEYGKKESDKLYAKLVNGALRSAPKTVNYNGNTILNPPDIVLQELGYLPVVYTDMPTDAPTGQHYKPHWGQTETEIVQVWELVEDVVMPEGELTADEALQIIMGVVE